MAKGTLTSRDSGAGFSLVEMLVVVAIIAVMLAIAIPNLAGFLRNYNIQGAAREVATEIQAARSKAVGTNTNAGVTFAVVSQNTYRYVMEDLPAAEQLGPLLELPNNCLFVASGTANAGPTLRYDRLGNRCNPVAGGNCRPAPAVLCTAAEVTRNVCSNAPANYIGQDTGTGTATGVPLSLFITIRENSTRLVRTVRIAPGGRVLPQQ